MQGYELLPINSRFTRYPDIYTTRHTNGNDLSRFKSRCTNNIKKSDELRDLHVISNHEQVSYIFYRFFFSPCVKERSKKLKRFFLKTSRQHIVTMSERKQSKSKESFSQYIKLITNKKLLTLRLSQRLFNYAFNIFFSCEQAIQYLTNIQKYQN